MCFWRPLGSRVCSILMLGFWCGKLRGSCHDTWRRHQRKMFESYDQNNGNYISRTLTEIDHFYIHFICITRRRAPSYRTIKKWKHFFFILLACISELLSRYKELYHEIHQHLNSSNWHLIEWNMKIMKLLRQTVFQNEGRWKTQQVQKKARMDKLEEDY